MQTRTNNTAREVAEFLKTLDRAAVSTHVGADGDAIGSAAALVYLLRFLGAEAVFSHREGVPAYLRWLLPDEPLTELPANHDLLVVDTSRADRVGVDHDEDNPVRLNLDHHEDNPLYGEYNIVDGKAAASAEIVAKLYKELDVSLKGRPAEAIYTGISTDTGGFRFRNVSTVDNADYERANATELDSKESIDRLRTVCGVEVVAHLREVEGGTKASLRSESVDVGEIARRFGGGGHRLAAGYTTSGKKPEEAKDELLAILGGVVNLDNGGAR